MMFTKEQKIKIVEFWYATKSHKSHKIIGKNGEQPSPTAWSVLLCFFRFSNQRRNNSKILPVRFLVPPSKPKCQPKIQRWSSVLLWPTGIWISKSVTISIHCIHCPPPVFGFWTRERRGLGEAIMSGQGVTPVSIFWTLVFARNEAF